MFRLVVLLLTLNILLSNCEYNEFIANKCLYLSQLTYCGDFSQCYRCTIDFVTERFDSLAIQGFDYDTKSIYTAFRGSSNIHNWVENFQVTHVAPYINQSIFIEKGFYKNYNYIKNELFKNMEMLVSIYNTHQLIVTGHSLGSAAGTLFVYDIVNGSFDYDVTFYNFGSPRVGNLEFVDDYNRKVGVSYRIVHNNDIVTSVPPITFGYQHVSQGICYNELSDIYNECDDISCELHSCSSNDHMLYLNMTLGENGCNFDEYI